MKTSSTMTVIVLSHSLSCMYYTPWFFFNVNNWDHSLWLLASNQWYHDGQFISSLMLALYLCLNFFISSRIKIEFPFFNQCSMINIVFIGEHGIHQKGYQFNIVYHNESLFVNQIQIIIYVQFICGVWYWGKICVFCNNKI